MTNKGLTNQIYLYSLETKDFYTDEELHINNLYFKALRLKNKIKPKLNENKEYVNYCEDKDEDNLESAKNRQQVIEGRYNIVLSYINTYKKELTELISEFPKNKPRTLRDDSLQTNKKIGLFESALTRTCGFETNQTTDKMFVIRIFHYEILKSIIDNGFIYENEEYIYLTSSAGQIRTKKIVVINKNLYEQHEKTVTCDLSLSVINSKGGVNANKYQAYLALANSASMKWNRFNIDRIVVVDDICTNVNTEVDYIDSKTFEIERKVMDVPIEHMDGCGIMLPTVSKKSFMFRMPWVKGLLTPFSFDEFVKKNNGSSKIKDVYGKEYDIFEDRINIILTKSQFKMWKFYNSWDDYKEKFKKYKCEASKLNIEDLGTKASINYQMLQTLTSMSKDELECIAQTTVEDILKLGKDKKTMLKVLGAVKENKNMNYFQKSLLKYPELLSDSHSREVIKNKKRRLVRDAKAGKLQVNGYYTFIIPDLYAFCEWLFKGEKNPKGLLKSDQVYCKAFNEGEVDILRAPHLYREHAIRNNTLAEEISKWFITQGVYTSVHDPISKILQFDNDGDKGLVVQDETLISIAKRDMKGVVPLYYEMLKAKDEVLDSELIYNALTSAYKANIGIISNEITKIWNSPEPNEEAVKWLCMYNNFVIDYAKTLFMPEKPPHVDEELKKFSKNKLPHFFKYAKDKEDKQVDGIDKDNAWGNSTVNKLEFMIPDNPIRFKNIAGGFDYRVLMNNPYVHNNEEVIKTFDKLNKKKHNLMKSNNLDDNGFNIYLQNELSNIESNNIDVVDILVKHYFVRNSKFKETLWSCFGDIVYENIVNNLGNTIQCDKCNTRFEQKSQNVVMCEKCLKNQEKLLKKERNKRYYDKFKTKLKTI